MAKVIRTEQLSIDGDKIRLTADNGNLIVNSVDGDSITPVVSTDEIGSDISSLAVADAQTNSDISSLAALNTTVNSTLVDFSAYNVYSLETSTLSTGPGSSSQTITLSNRAFVSEPNITATLHANADDPIIAVSVSNVVETSTAGVYEATFQFSDELPATGESDQATNYRLNILAAVNAADQDLDTIVDPVDSDRDGDGVENSLDYDPDDSSIGSTPATLVEILATGRGDNNDDAEIADNEANADFIDFIQALDSTYHSELGSPNDWSASSTDGYELNTTLVLELYNSDETTYIKDIELRVWHEISSTSRIKLIWGDENGRLEFSGVTVGRYLKIKST